MNFYFKKQDVPLFDKLKALKEEKNVRLSCKKTFLKNIESKKLFGRKIKVVDNSTICLNVF